MFLIFVASTEFGKEDPRAASLDTSKLLTCSQLKCLEFNDNSEIHFGKILKYLLKGLMKKKSRY